MKGGELNRIFFIDIDGTLTNSKRRDGDPIESRIKAVRQLILKGYGVVLWSATGTTYARMFAKKHNLNVLAAIAKPDVCIDDHAEIRKGGLKVFSPDEYFR